MKKIGIFCISFMLFVLVMSGCSTNEESKKQEAGTEKVELTISAAASLQDAINEIKTAYEKENSNVKINLNFGASGALQQQISKGAPVDLFFSAAEDKFDQLVDEKFIEKDKGIDLLGNEIVLVVPKDSDQSIKEFEDLPKAKKIAIGTPETVPAGQYGKEMLENLGVWKDSEEKVVYAKDVRQVLTYVETENVDAGIVYKTDALTSEKVKITATASEDTHTPIIYPVGVIKESSHLEEANDFYEYLQTEKAMEIFVKYGFADIN